MELCIVFPCCFIEAFPEVLQFLTFSDKMIFIIDTSIIGTRLACSRSPYMEQTSDQHSKAAPDAPTPKGGVLLNLLTSPPGTGLSKTRE